MNLYDILWALGFVVVAVALPLTVVYTLTDD